jgi:hypothetical protein
VIVDLLLNQYARSNSAPAGVPACAGTLFFAMLRCACRQGARQRQAVPAVGLAPQLRREIDSREYSREQGFQALIVPAGLATFRGRQPLGILRTRRGGNCSPVLVIP